MSEITALQRFSAAFGMPLVEVKTDTTSLYEMAIYDDKESLLGCKVLVGGLEHKVNVGSYARRLLNVSPIDPSVDGFVVPANRSVTLGLELDDQQVDVHLAGGREPLVADTLLSDMPRVKSIMTTEYDELSFLASAGSLEASITMYDCRGLELALEPQMITLSSLGLVSYALNMPALATRLEQEYGRNIDEFDSFVLSISSAQQQLAQVEYRIVSGSGERVHLCWWNRYGAVDHYSFLMAGEQKIKVNRADGSLHGLPTTTPLSVEHTFQVVAEAADGLSLGYVADLTCSPRVWLFDGEYRQVAVMTEEYQFGCDEPKNPLLTIREYESNGINL